MSTLSKDCNLHVFGYFIFQDCIYLETLFSGVLILRSKVVDMSNLSVHFSVFPIIDTLHQNCSL